MGTKIVFTKKQENFIRKTYLADRFKGARKIAQTIGCSEGPVYRWLHEQKLCRPGRASHPIINDKRKCVECKRTKHITCFGKNGTNKKGYRTICKKCHVIISVRGARKRFFGLTNEEYESKVKAQNGCCAICGRKERRLMSKKSGYSDTLAVDHDHDTGKIRDLLCSNCNSALGLLRENSDTAYAMHLYLVRWKT